MRLKIVEAFKKDVSKQPSGLEKKLIQDLKSCVEIAMLKRTKQILEMKGCLNESLKWKIL